jgi:hypothetical protein
MLPAFFLCCFELGDVHVFLPWCSKWVTVTVRHAGV